MYAPALRKAGMRVATRVQTRTATSLAAFKTPAVLNEPNVSVLLRSLQFIVSRMQDAN